MREVATSAGDGTHIAIEIDHHVNLKIHRLYRTFFYLTAFWAEVRVAVNRGVQERSGNSCVQFVELILVFQGVCPFCP